MPGLSVTTNTRETKRTPMRMLRGWVGRGICGTALVASLVALGPRDAGAEGTTAAGTLLVILGLGQVGAESQPLKGTAVERKVNRNMAFQAELQKLPGVGETTAKKIVAGRPYNEDPSRALASSTGRVSESVKSGSVEAHILPTTERVWANVKSGMFHRAGERWYGKTEQGRVMTEAEARKAGYRSAAEGAAGQTGATRAPE